MHYNTIKTNWITLFHSIIWSEANSIHKQGQVWITNIANWNLKWMHAFCIYFHAHRRSHSYALTYSHAQPQCRDGHMDGTLYHNQDMAHLLSSMYFLNWTIFSGCLFAFSLTTSEMQNDCNWYVCTVMWCEHIPKWPNQSNSIRQV